MPWYTNLTLRPKVAERMIQELKLPQSDKVLHLQAIFARLAHGGARGRRVYLALREAIFEDVFAGSASLRERWLAEALGVSRTPVREALKRLVAEGLLKDVPEVGLVAHEPGLQDIEEIYSLRICLEGMAAGLAADMATDSDMSVLTRMQTQFERACEKDEVTQMTNVNAQFHDAICRAGKNQRLAELVNLFHDSVQRVGSTTLGYPGRCDEAIQEHRALLDAIRRRDAAAAKRIAEEHMQHAKRIRLAMHSTGTSRLAASR